MPATARHNLTRSAKLLVLAVVTAACVCVLPALSAPANALTVRRGDRVVAVAASRKGDPYKWGAEGPRRFDCSGLTQWSYARVGKRIPRVAADQYRHTRHISRRQRRRGDLVFFHSGRRTGSIYHVGIYAGHGFIWNAPHTGARVRRERIWTRHVWYGRVR